MNKKYYTKKYLRKKRSWDYNFNPDEAMMPQEIVAKVSLMISELSLEKLKGMIFFYKEDECSCCYFPGTENDFTINGNVPGNWGGYKWEGKVSFNQDLKGGEMIILYNALKKTFRGTGYFVEWEGLKTSAIMIKIKK